MLGHRILRGPAESGKSRDPHGFRQRPQRGPAKGGDGFKSHPLRHDNLVSSDPQAPYSEAILENRYQPKKFDPRGTRTFLVEHG